MKRGPINHLESAKPTKKAKKDENAMDMNDNLSDSDVENSQEDLSADAIKQLALIFSSMNLDNVGASLLDLNPKEEKKASSTTQTYNKF